MKIKASEAVPGQWYQLNAVARVLCVKINVFYNQVSGLHHDLDKHDLTHLPDCTGWDWEKPKPEKRYREFVTFGEWWPHRERWVQHEQYVHKNYWESREQMKKWFDDGAVFLNDDGSDGEPFGVEMSE